MMDAIWIGATLLVVFVFLFWLILVWRNKRKLNKMMEEYNAEEDKSKPSESFRQNFRRDKPNGIPPTTPVGVVGGIGSVEKSKLDSKPIGESEGGSVLQDASPIESGNDEHDSEEDWPEFE